MVGKVVYGMAVSTGPCSQCYSGSCQPPTDEAKVSATLGPQVPWW